jgi:hypothetical protein
MARRDVQAQQWMAMNANSKAQIKAAVRFLVLR